MILEGLILLAESFAHTCEQYEPVQVTLVGVLNRQVFPGPPNYESIEQGDAAESYFFLKPERPFCVAEPASDISGGFDVATELVAEVQLVFLADPKELYDSLRPDLGKQIRCVGTLFGAQTASHRTEVLLSVSYCDVKHY